MPKPEDKGLREVTWVTALGVLLCLLFSPKIPQIILPAVLWLAAAVLIVVLVRSYRDLTRNVKWSFGISIVTWITLGGLFFHVVQY